MTLFLDDGDVRLYHGDALETVRAMPDGSVDCVVTSPPYWGLRDYGTGEWDGGDPDCDHLGKPHATQAGFNERWSGKPSGTDKQGELREPFREVCGKCGARRVDQQMGLEPTPDLFVQGMVELFREIRRVLAPHGTCWVNLGDSYASGGAGWRPGNPDKNGGNSNRDGTPVPEGLKPKDLVGIPWRVAFALQADGWWLRSDIIWAKPNPMPESVTDRPTKAHEYVFLLTKQPRYWFDTEAVREPAIHAGTVVRYGPDAKNHTAGDGTNDRRTLISRDIEVAAGRNVRSVWQIATQPYPEAHFATYPEELARRCILAGCPTRVCRVCGKPSERIVERGEPTKNGRAVSARVTDSAHSSGARIQPRQRGHDGTPTTETVGWSDCGCLLSKGVTEPTATPGGSSPFESKYRPGVVLDPFIGSGTTAKVARDHQRHAIGIDLNQEYLELAARRLQQLSLLNAT